MRQMEKFFLDVLLSLYGLGCNGMGFGENNGTELNHELLKARVIKLLGFPFIHELNIDVPD